MGLFGFGPSKKNALWDFSPNSMTMITTALSLAGDAGLPDAEELLYKVMRRKRITAEEAGEIVKMMEAFLPSAVSYVKERKMLSPGDNPMEIGKNAINYLRAFYDL